MRSLPPVLALVALVALVALGAPAAAAPAAPPDSAPSPRWRLPLDGALHVVHGFAPPAQRWLAGHRGVDLAAAKGATVRAAGDGVVGYAGSLAGVPVITVLHGDLRTTYQPVRATVRRGQRVAAGAALGRLARPGGHCLPAACLHWGLLRGSTYLDPLSLVRRGPPRLLPLDGDLPARRGTSASPADGGFPREARGSAAALVSTAARLAAPVLTW